MFSEQRPASGFISGDDAAHYRGIDLRHCYREGDPHPTLLGAVRFAEPAAVGSAFFTSAHGGAIQTALDEATAELAKAYICPVAVTTAANTVIKKPAELHCSYQVEVTISKQISEVRWEVIGKITDTQSSPPKLIAQMTANMVDITKLDNA